MSDKTLMKQRERSLRGTLRRSNLSCKVALFVLDMTKVILWLKTGKWFFKASCRFNSVVSDLFLAFNIKTENGAMHRYKNLAKTNIAELCYSNNYSSIKTGGKK